MKTFRQLKLLLLTFFITAGTVFSQTTITGIVTDKQKEPLTGVAITIKETTVGTITNVDGSYSLSVNNISSGSTIVFSYIGFRTEEVVYGGNNTINVELSEDALVLSEVVVTALGIRREEKSLGYSTSNIENEQLMRVSPPRWTDALTGKVAGLSIMPSGSGPNGSSRISLRGDNSMNLAGNDALIVIDGVPVNNKLRGTGFGAYMGDDNSVDFGNRMGDLNPDDIASVTVLKGASASALYGSRAANGVLLITTKAGSQNRGIGVSFNTSYAFEDVLHYPHYQYEYGEGSENAQYYSYGNTEDGRTQIGTATFGPKFDPNKLFYQYNPNDPNGVPAERTPWVAYKNNRKQFFRTGHVTTNTLSIDGATDNTSARISVGYTNKQWIMPNTGFDNINVSAAVDHQVSRNLKISARTNYSQRDNKNIPNSGYNNHTIGYMMLFLQPNYDMNWYKQGYWIEEDVFPKRIGDYNVENPYFIANEILNTSLRRNYTTSMSATYSFSPQLELMIRSGIDNSNEGRKQRRPWNIERYPEGMFREQLLTDFEINTDALLTYRTSLGMSTMLNMAVGGNLMQSRYRSLVGYASKLAVPGIYNLANSKDAPVVTSDNIQRNINSLYGLVTLSYQEKLFLDLTARNDWSSTLPQDNKSYFYPSVTVSTLVNEVFSMPGIIDMFKLRASWAQVGNDAAPYRILKYYSQGDFPGSVVNPNVLSNSDLKPEITSSYELGLEVRMYRNRLGLDVTYYNSVSKNQILDMAMTPETGYARRTMNSGEIRNRGVEVLLSGRPITTYNFTWDISVNGSTNKNKVLSLAEGMDYQPIGEAEGAAYIRAKVGGSTGDIYGYKFLRTDDGQIIYKADGTPELTTEHEYVGNAYAKFKAGLINTFRYKNVTFNFQFDGQWGAMVYSQSHHKMSQRGRLDNTLAGREEGFVIGEGVVINSDGMFLPNMTQVNPQRFYDQYYRRDNAESNTLDASFVKLREMSIQYIFPGKIVSMLKLQDLSMSVFGQNLLLFSKFPIFDPETAQLGDGAITPGVEMGQLPSTRTIGISLKTRF